MGAYIARLFANIGSGKNVRVLMIGLDAAGKTVRALESLIVKSVKRS